MLKYPNWRDNLKLRSFLPMLALMTITAAPASAHFFGATQEIDDYQVIFAPYPSSPVIGENSTLNFSVIENGHNLFNIYSAVRIQDLSTGEIIFQDPYRQYEISDITIPYVFADSGNFAVTLETRIPEHEKYQTQPLSATFQISTSPTGTPVDELLIYYVTPATVAGAGIMVYLRLRNMI